MQRVNITKKKSCLSKLSSEFIAKRAAAVESVSSAEKRSVRFDETVVSKRFKQTEDGDDDEQEEEDGEQAKLVQLLDIIVKITRLALESSMAGNDADFRPYDTFRYELASLHVEENENLPRKRRQDMAVQLCNEISRADPLLQQIFVNKRDSTRVVVTSRDPTAGLENLSAIWGQVFYGFGVSQVFYGLFMEQVIKRRITYEIIHAGGPSVTNVGVRFLHTTGVDITQLVKECILCLDSTTGIFADVMHLQTFSYVQRREVRPLVKEQMCFKMRVRRRRNVQGSLRQWDWTLSAARSLFTPAELIFYDGSEGGFDRDEMLKVIDKSNADEGKFLELVKFVESEFAACKDLSAACLKQTNSVKKASRALDLAERYRELSERINENAPTDVRRGVILDGIPFAKLWRQIMTRDAHSRYYAAAFFIIAGDYHTSIVMYASADAPFQMYGGGTYTEQYICFLFERVFVNLYSIITLPHAADILQKIDNLIDPLVPDVYSRGLTNTRRRDKTIFNVFARRKLNEFIEFHNTCVPDYHKLLKHEETAYNDWRRAQFKDLFDSSLPPPTASVEEQKSMFDRKEYLGDFILFNSRRLKHLTMKEVPVVK
jgi:hypothetical protein